MLLNAGMPVLLIKDMLGLSTLTCIRSSPRGVAHMAGRKWHSAILVISLSLDKASAMVKAMVFRVQFSSIPVLVYKLCKSSL